MYMYVCFFVCLHRRLAWHQCSSRSTLVNSIILCFWQWWNPTCILFLASDNACSLSSLAILLQCHVQTEQVLRVLKAANHNDYHYKPSSRAQTLWVRGQEGNKYVKYPTTVFGNSTRYTTPLLLVKFVSEINYCSGSRSHDLWGTACPGCMACILPGPNGVVIYHCRVHNFTLNAQNEWQMLMWKLISQ